MQVGRNYGRNMKAVFEDTRPALNDDTFATFVQEIIDTLEREIEKTLDSIEISIDKIVIAMNDTDDDTPDLADPMTVFTEVPEIEPSLGLLVDVYQPIDMCHYRGTVESIPNGKHTIEYDDGQKENLDMSSETGRFSAFQQNIQAVTAATVERTNCGQTDLLGMTHHFGNKTFLGHRAQGFLSYLKQYAYMKGEDSYKKTVQVVS